jgi:arylsulfatase A-like enzyme
MAFGAPDPASGRGADHNARLTAQALGFVGEASRFFLYLPYTLTSCGGSRAVAVTQLDAQIGRIVAAAAGGAPQNLCVIFFGSSGHGATGTLWEAGHRVPAIAHWPGTVRAGAVSSALCCNLDLRPTIAAAAGIADAPVRGDGQNLLPIFAGRGMPATRTLCWSYSGSRAVRRGAWKYLLNRHGDRKGEFLFNLADDPAEQENRILDQPERAAELRAVMRTWERDVRSAA